jgi:hypothetical protein
VRQRGGRGGRVSPSTGRSYTARLERAKPYRPPRHWHLQAAAAAARVLPAWLTRAETVVLLVLGAEAGHLVAAWTEWPAAAARGWFQVVVAGLLGAAAVTMYFDRAPIPVGLALAATVVVPTSWLVGALAGASPYARYPAGAATTTTIAELAAAALLAIALLNLTTVTPPPRRSR